MLHDLQFGDMGVCFSLTGSNENTDRPWPFDIIPRTIGLDTWSEVALDLFKERRP